MSSPALSVVLPIYNESEAIVPVLEELIGVLQGEWPEAWEICAVDDGSSDDTAQQITALGEKHAGLRLISLQKNVGQSGALWMGIREAKAEWVATLDADGQNDPADLPKMYAEREGYDAVFGFRAARKDTFSKRIGSKWANGVRNSILKEDIVDTGCAIKIFRQHYMDLLTPWNGMHRFMGSLFALQGAKIHQLPVNHRPRSAGTSKYTNWGRLKKTIWDLFAVRWLRGRFVQPTLKG